MFLTLTLLQCNSPCIMENRVGNIWETFSNKNPMRNLNLFDFFKYLRVSDNMFLPMA